MVGKFVQFNRRLAAFAKRRFPNVFFRTSCNQILMQRVVFAIETEKPKVVMEVGGVDRPFLPRTKLYEYIGVDIDDRRDCKDVYDRFLVQSVERQMPIRADMILSITLLEHVPNNVASTKSIFASLNAGGSTHHYVPSKWHPYAICLRLVGPTMQKFLIRHLRPAAIGVTGYPVFFDHCTPAGMSRLFANAGFCDIDVLAEYNAADYFAFFFPAFVLVALFENLCSILDSQIFASGFVISAKKL